MDFVKVKPLATVLPVDLDAAATTHQSCERLDAIGVDGVIVNNLLTVDECLRLVGAAEQSGGFSFWDSEGNEDQRRVRNADTLEFDDPALCKSLYERLRPYLTLEKSFSPEDEDTFENELEGEWVATGLNTHLLINRYGTGGHFAPHADGSTVLSFNHRSLYTVLIYLNDCVEGGSTQILSGLDGATTVRPLDGARVAKPEAVLQSVAPLKGRALMYYHQVLHAGETVGKGSCKYCLRTDVMYERRPPVCTAPNDVQAYELVREARAREAAGEPMDAMKLYMRAAKMSHAVARACQLA